MPDPEPLIIVGSSARAAAQSAKRAGFEPWCIDQFGDRDLMEISPDAKTVTNWPGDVESHFGESPSTAWAYTGALENHPKLIDRLAEKRPLLGCKRKSLTCIRDPKWLAQTLAEASLPSLPVFVPKSASSTTDCRSANQDFDSPRHWLVKPLASGAGIGISNFDGVASDWQPHEGHFLQARASGRDISGLFLFTDSGALLLGLCENRPRGPQAGEFRYVYSSSFGPLSDDDLPQEVFDQAQRIGTAIHSGAKSSGFEIRGLGGIDFVHDDQSEKLWTLEINPRYTASAELYERAFGWPLMRWHVDACRPGSLIGEITRIVSEGFEGTHPADFCPSLTRRATRSIENDVATWRRQGKLIVYSPQDFSAPDIAPMIEQISLRRVRLDAPSSTTVRQDAPYDGEITVADIPQIGTTIRKDEPICTLLTEQQSVAACNSILTAAADRLLTLIDQTVD